MELDEIKRAIDGDDEAFLTLFSTYQVDLYKTALAFLRNEHDAVEAIQEVTYRAYKKIHTVKEPSYAKTWLIRIMINYCQDQIKRKKRFRFLLPSDERHVTPSNRLEIQELLQTLRPKDQELIYLKYILEVPIKEIAVVKNLPEGTVKSRLHRIVRELRETHGWKEESPHVY
ncbi:sigma-70 family RNA polymerase sigma factor [Paenisporosarcina cavernae]|uniref:Sigma-70 family RNA polymerase sigma factor n=1 Tax=Paenisporosarcina cavernae TaxID=2320858 RepID=A0A385YUB5_9BACL|nr:sigma-70 family RNA polymerase sigma factor [Paenisporosarcina cavernae]AYC30071.1 sigma-70 family RNA polymerase sigma factor [Paenisporosarcina cavernae]